MSDFILKFDQLNGTIDKFRDVSNSLTSAQSELNAQASRLSGMSGFGIPQIQAAIINLGRDLARLGSDTNDIATFVGELQSIVTNYENKAVTALGGTNGDSIDVGVHARMPDRYRTEPDDGLHLEPHKELARAMDLAVAIAISTHGDNFLRHLAPDIRRDILLLTGGTFNGVDYEARFKILQHMRDNDAQITFDDLVRFGVYNEGDSPRQANIFIDLLMLEYRMTRQDTTIINIELEWQQQNAATAIEILKEVAKGVKP